MTNDQENLELWSVLTQMDEAGDIDGAMNFALENVLRDEIPGQRYIAWAYSQKDDFANAGAWYLAAVRAGSSEAIEECYECAKLLDAKGDSDSLATLCASEPIVAMEKFQRLMVAHYHRAGSISFGLKWSCLLAARGERKDLVYVGKLYLFDGRPDEALHYLEQAAEKGDGEANQLVGEMYWQGVGVEKDQLKAAAFYGISSSQGFVLSESRLLHMKRSRRGLWYLPIFLIRILCLTLKSKVLASQNPEDPRISLIPSSGASVDPHNPSAG